MIQIAHYSGLSKFILTLKKKVRLAPNSTLVHHCVLLTDISQHFADSVCTDSCLLFHKLDISLLLGIKGIQSCLEVAEACVGDVVCNTQLAAYLKACSANGNLCDVKHCQAAIRFFYQNMPFNIAQMLAFCDCAPSDIPCQQSKEALHSKPCAVNVVPPPSCLDVIHSCRNDELCRWVKTRIP